MIIVGWQLVISRHAAYGGPLWTVPLLVTSFILTAQFFEVAQRLASTPFNMLQSYVLIGVLMSLCLVVAAMKHGTVVPTSSV